MGVPIVFEIGGSEGAEALRLDGELLHVVSPRAFAPGEPAAFTAEVENERMGLQGKAIGSKRRDDGRFDVRFRLVNLRRTHREALSTALG